MKCHRARKQMIPFLDGELEESSEFKSHIETCDRCREEMGQFQQSFEKTILQEEEMRLQIQPPPYLLSRLKQRIDAFEERTHWRNISYALRWFFAKERIAMIGWMAALVLLSIQLGKHIRVEAVSYNTGMHEYSAESRIKLKIGDMIQIPLIRIIEE